MGYGSYTAGDWSALRKSRKMSEKSAAAAVFDGVDENSRGVYGLSLRESRDSSDSPRAVPVIIGFDVTSSMGYLARELALNAVNRTVMSLYERRPAGDPHIMCAAIGDCKSDRLPLQVTQFEADIRIIKQLTALKLEGGGGGNDGESYNLLWYFAHRHTSADEFEKRSGKGFLITIGDDKCHPRLSENEIAAVFGDRCSGGLSNEELLRAAERKYHVFHINIEKGEARDGEVFAMWQRLMNGRVTVIHKKDIGYLSELITLLIYIGAGKSRSEAFEGMEQEAVKCLSRSAAMLTQQPRSGGKLVF